MTAPQDPKNDWVAKNPTDPQSEWRYTADEQNLVAENIIWIKANPGGGGGSTNLSTTRTASTVTVVATPGTDAVLPAADGTNAGIMTAAQQTLLTGAIQTSTKNVANGVLGLNASGLANPAQLPSYVDDVLEFANFAAFPGTGETGKIYVAIATGLQYRWSGAVYIQLVSSPGTTDAVTEGTTNLYYTNARADARVVAGITGKLDTSAAPELIRDTMGTALVPGTNITIVPNDAGDTITISASGGGGGYTPGGTDVAITDGGTGVSTLPAGLLKGAGTSPITAAVAGTDYVAPGGTDIPITDGGTGVSTLPTGLLKGAGTGAITAGVQGTDYYAPAGTDVAIVDGGTGASTAAAARTNLATRLPRVAAPVTNATSWTVNSDLADVAENNGLTASVLINNPTGTPVASQELVLALTGTAARAITYGTAFEASAVPLPTTTVTTARLDILFRWNTVTSKWRCIYYTTSSAAGGYTPGGTDVALADGGTGASLTAPGADRIMFWDQSAGSTAYLTAGSGLTITGTTMTASGGGGGATNVPSGWADVVRDHGAVGDGVTNDGNAFRAAAATGLPVWVPAGTYAFSGAGISQNDLIIAGPGPGKTLIALGAGVYFIDGSNDVNTLKLSGINFIGGAGVFRSTYTGTAVRSYRIFQDCLFHDYTSTCIGHRHADSPYWKFVDCEFRGANDSTTIGIALNGLNDDNLFQHCTFEMNRVHLKLKEGANAHINGGCSFFRWVDYTSNPRIDIWIVPRTAAEVTAAGGNFADAGSGFSIQETKFGNEGLSGNDYRVVIADALAGNFETALPNLAANSTSVWIGGTFTNLHNSLIGGTCPPFIYSTTPNLYAVQAGNFAHIGSDSLAAARVLQLRTATGFDPTINAIGPVMTGADPINGQVLVAATSGTLTGQPKYIGGGS